MFQTILDGDAHKLELETEYKTISNIRAQLETALTAR